MLKIYDHGTSEKFIFEGNQVFIQQKVTTETILEDGLSLGYPDDSGTFDVCEYVECKAEKAEEALKLWTASTAFKTPRKRCVPRYSQFLELEADPDDFESDSNYRNVADRDTKEIQQAIRDGNTQIVHKFKWGENTPYFGSTLYKIHSDEGEGRYFIESKDIHDPQQINYSYVIESDEYQNINDAIQEAVKQDQLMHSAKEAQRKLTALLRAIWKEEKQ